MYKFANIPTFLNLTLVIRSIFSCTKMFSIVLVCKPDSTFSYHYLKKGIWQEVKESVREKRLKAGEEEWQKQIAYEQVL